MATALSKSLVAIERSFLLGMVRDTARHMIPPGGAYDLKDFFVDRPGVTYKRGGSEFQSSILTDEVIIVACAAPEYPGDPRVIAVGSDGSGRTLYDVTGVSAGVGIDVHGAQPTENPPSVFINDTIGLAVILTDGLDTEDDGYYAPQKVYLSSGTLTVAALAGSPPNARYSCAHLSYLVLANSDDHPNRLWFSPVPDLEGTWDTDNAYIDVDHEITGLASIQGILIVFQRGQCHRILGSVPPGTVGEDMETQPLGNVGCVDARSIVKMDNLVYFANEHGIYYTNGAGFQSITEKDDGTGISQFWAEEMADFAPALGALVACGTYLNTFLFVSIRHEDGSTQQLMWFATQSSWVRLGSAVTATMYATRFAPNSEIYAGCGLTTSPARLLRLSPLFLPTSANATDANGEGVLPLLETRAIGVDLGRKHYDFAHIVYDLRDEIASDPVLTVTEAVGVEAPTFAAVDEGGTLAETTEATRARVMLSRESSALSLRLAQTGASASTEVYSVETEYRADPLSEDG